MPPKTGIFARKAAFAAVPFVLFGLIFAAGEWYCRLQIARIPPLGRPSGVKHPPSFHNPGVVSSAKVFGWHIKYRINNEGLRGPDTTVAKPAGLKRVLILGDSVAFGAMVQDDGTLPVQLERLMNGAGPRRWEALNGAVGGYDAVDYEGFLRLKGLAFKPDVVIVGIYRNDHILSLENAQASAKDVGAAPSTLAAKIRSLVFKSELLNTAMYFMQRHQAPKRPWFAVKKPFTRRDREIIASFLPGDPGSAAAVEDFLKVYRYDAFPAQHTLRAMLDLKAWGNIRGPLASMRRLCRERGIRLMGVVFPSQFEVYPGYAWPEPSRTIMEIFRSLGIPAVDLQPVWAATGRGDEMYPMRYDLGHPGREAYALASDALLEKMEQSGWMGSE